MEKYEIGDASEEDLTKSEEVEKCNADVQIYQMCISISRRKIIEIVQQISQFDLRESLVQM